MQSSHRIISPAPPLSEEIEKPDALTRFLRGSLTLMTERNRNSVTIPYPLVSAIIAIVLWLGGASAGGIYAFATLSAKVDAMNTSLLLRDAQIQRERDEDNKRRDEENRQLHEQIENAKAYANQLRVEMARAGVRAKEQER